MSRIIVPVAMLALLGACGSKSDEPTQREQIGQTWKYEQQGGADVAYIGSANSVVTPTAPDTFAVMLLQKMRDGQTGVTIKTVGAPFTCDLSDCTVEARVDGAAAQTWKGRMTDQNDGIAVLPSQDPIGAIRKAKSVTVKVGLGPKVQQDFTFNTTGLKWPS